MNDREPEHQDQPAGQRAWREPPSAYNAALFPEFTTGVLYEATQILHLIHSSLSIATLPIEPAEQRQALQVAQNAVQRLYAWLRLGTLATHTTRTDRSLSEDAPAWIDIHPLVEQCCEQLHQAAAEADEFRMRHPEPMSGPYDQLHVVTDIPPAMPAVWINQRIAEQLFGDLGQFLRWFQLTGPASLVVDWTTTQWRMTIRCQSGKEWDWLVPLWAEFQVHQSPLIFGYAPDALVLAIQHLRAIQGGGELQIASEPLPGRGAILTLTLLLRCQEMEMN